MSHKTDHQKHVEDLTISLNHTEETKPVNMHGISLRIPHQSQCAIEVKAVLP
jgi:hypothetical protein